MNPYKTLRLTRLVTAASIGLTAGICAEAFTAMENQYVIKQMPGLLSIIFFISAIIGSFQFLLSKIGTRVTVWLPWIIDLFILSFVAILFFNHMYLACLITAIFGEAILAPLFLNRMNKITDVIKHHNNLNSFLNFKSSLFSIGTLIGYVISFMLVRLGVTYDHIWIFGYLCWAIPIYPILYIENLILMKKDV